MAKNEQAADNAPKSSKSDNAQKASEAANAQKQTPTNKSGGAAERIPPSPEGETGTTAADSISAADKGADKRHAEKEAGGE